MAATLEVRVVKATRGGWHVQYRTSLRGSWLIWHWLRIESEARSLAALIVREKRLLRK